MSLSYDNQTVIVISDELLNSSVLNAVDMALDTITVRCPEMRCSAMGCESIPSYCKLNRDLRKCSGQCRCDAALLWEKDLLLSTILVSTTILQPESTTPLGIIVHLFFQDSFFLITGHNNVI